MNGGKLPLKHNFQFPFPSRVKKNNDDDDNNNIFDLAFNETDIM